MSENVRQFLEDIRPYHNLFNSLDIRVVAYQAGEAWINIATRITLLASSPTDLKLVRKLPKLENLSVIHAIYPARKLEAILDELSQSKIRLNKFEIIYGRSDDKGIGPQLSLHNSIYSRNRPGFYSGINYKTFILTDSGTSIHMIIKNREKIEWQLRAWNPPYDGLRDLSINFLCSSRPLDYNDSSFIEVVAPTFLRFGEKCRFKTDELILEIEHPQNLEIKNVRLGLVRQSMKGDIMRHLYGMKGYQIQRENSRTCFRKKVRDCQSVQVFLKYNEDVADTVEVLNPKSAQFNPLLAMQRQYDHNLGILQTLIQGDKNHHGINLEAGIPLLLSIAGFQCLPYATTKKMQNGPDGVAILPKTKQGFIYECTTGLPDTKNKLSKLSRRFKELRKRNPALDLKPVIFTSVESDVIPDIEMDKASNEGISIVGNEHMSEILEAVKNGCQGQSILDYLNQLMPLRCQQRSTFF